MIVDKLGRTNLAITSVYLRGIDNTEIIHTIHERPAPTIPAHTASSNRPRTDRDGGDRRPATGVRRR
jgi:hypothetical protein